jgi:hypothetical protein
MKKLLIAATLAAAALGATPLLAQQAAPKTARTDADCPMAGEHANRNERHAEMRKRMQEMHARMGPREGRGRDRDAEHEHEHK